jgi:hypothetical protein
LIEQTMASTNTQSKKPIRYSTKSLGKKLKLTRCHFGLLEYGLMVVSI